MSGRRRFAALALAAATLALASCGGDGEESASSGADPLGELRVGSVAQLAQCRDWNGGTRAERLATIDDIREQVNLEDAPVRTPELSDEVAYEVLDNSCAHEFADGFRLYKLYARATGFASLAEPATPP